MNPYELTMATLLAGWKKLLIALLIGAVVGALISTLTKPTWEATTLLQTGPLASSEPHLSNPLELVVEPLLTVIEKMQSQQFILAATKKAGRPELALILMRPQDGGKGLFKAQAVRGTDILKVSIRAESKKDAQDALTAVVQEIVRLENNANQPTLTYIQRYIESSERLLEQYLSSYSDIAKILDEEKLKSKTDPRYLNLLVLQGQNSIAIASLSGSIKDAKIQYLSADSKMLHALNFSSIPVEQVSPKLAVLSILGALAGLILMAAYMIGRKLVLLQREQ